MLYWAGVTNYCGGLNFLDILGTGHSNKNEIKMLFFFSQFGNSVMGPIGRFSGPDSAHGQPVDDPCYKVSVGSKFQGARDK